jgi:hypothetical protein
MNLDLTCLSRNAYEASLLELDESATGFFEPEVESGFVNSDGVKSEMPGQPSQSQIKAAQLKIRDVAKAIVDCTFLCSNSDVLQQQHGPLLQVLHALQTVIPSQNGLHLLTEESVKQAQATQAKPLPKRRRRSLKKSKNTHT